MSNDVPIFNIPLNKYSIPEGIHSGIIQSYEYIKGFNDKPDIIVLKVYSNLTEYRIPVYLSENSSWKILDLFKSAGILESCIVNGSLRTEWDKLVGKMIYFISNGKNVTKFISKDIYEATTS